MASEVMNEWVQRVLGVNPVAQAPIKARAGAGKVELTKRLLAIKDPATAAGLAARLLEVRDAVVASSPDAEAMLASLERDVAKPVAEPPRGGDGGADHPGGARAGEGGLSRVAQLPRFGQPR